MPPTCRMRPRTARRSAGTHIATCGSGADVVQYVVEGMGHRWPTKHAPLRRHGVVTWMLGPTSTNIDATETIWEFFKAHPKP